MVQEEEKIGDNVPSFTARMLSQNPSIQQADSDLQLEAITEEELIEDLRDAVVEKCEQNMLINDKEINPKFFAAWAQLFN